MNLAIRGIDGHLGNRDADTFGNDLHKNLRADYILANPPFNVSDYTLIQDDARWKYGIPPKNNANYAWIQHIISKLSPKGVAGFVLANGSMSTSTKAEAEIRKNIIEAGLVDCIVTMPPNLFYNVTIPVCLWFLSKKRANRKDSILFIDARKMGTMVTRKHRELSAEEIAKIYDTYHHWRESGSESAESMVAEKAKLYQLDNYKKEEIKEYEDIQGFCKSASIEEVREHEYILTPGRYVGIEKSEEDSEPFDEKMTRLTAELAEMLAKSHKLEEEIKERLGAIGYEF